MSAQRTAMIWESKVDPYDKLILLALEECSGSNGEHSYWSGDVEHLAGFIGTNSHMLEIFHLQRFRTAGILTRDGLPGWASESWRFDLTPILDYDPYAEYEAKRAKAAPAPKSERKKVRGYVYLLKGREYYKIGRAVNPWRREETLAIQLPFPVQLVHTIETDDSYLAERALHERYSASRVNGEWFCLTPNEVDEIRQTDTLFHGDHS